MESRLTMRKFILDIDTGIDDALALTYLLSRRKEAEVLGVTATYGNTTLEGAYENTIRMLGALKRLDVRVYKGANHPLLSEYDPEPLKKIVHGENGIGNVELPEVVVEEETISAWDFMIESGKKYGSELTIIAVGPMTDLAKAFEKDKDVFKDVKFVLMGGALGVPGNASQFAEANFHEDPPAAKIVLESGLDITMVGLDVTMQTLITGSDISKWEQYDNIAAKALYDMSEYYYTFESNNAANPSGCLHDPLAVEVAINPDIISQYLCTDLTCETEGPSKGRSIGKVDKIHGGEDTTKVALQVKEQEFKDKFVNSISELLKTL